ncbi:hypothetical protein B0W44_02330 [Novibacillus thermophilus]|uniref:Mechanosensitive ion channel protein MscS n=2 Tax=Novibacillus thermophilus TaxID=1471761 RepID=A0A1U9K420_9BACL|nr:hypothetical protein B0W44_02330 [Novibacillus thermophilus]
MEDMSGHLLNFIQQHFESYDPLTTYIVPVLKTAVIVVISYIILRYSGNWIDRLFKLRHIDEKRAATLSKLLKSVVRYVVYFVAAVTILLNFGVDLMPIFAGAGIVGLAIGFGAQNLVKDVITGFFLIFENQLHVGDYVEVNGKISGTVEEIGLRVTKIREWNERLHYLSNGEISQITNYNRDRMRPLVSVVVPYEENQKVVEQTLDNICHDLFEKYEPYFLEKPSVYGITNLDREGVHYTMMAVTVPEQYWFVERAMRKAIIYTFKSQNIQISYPRRVLFGSQGDNGLPLPIEKLYAERQES